MSSKTVTLPRALILGLLDVNARDFNPFQFFASMKSMHVLQAADGLNQLVGPTS